MHIESNTTITLNDEERYTLRNILFYFTEQLKDADSEIRTDFNDDVIFAKRLSSLL